MHHTLAEYTLFGADTIRRGKSPEAVDIYVDEYKIVTPDRSLKVRDDGAIFHKRRTRTSAQMSVFDIDFLLPDADSQEVSHFLRQFQAERDFERPGLRISKRRHLYRVQRTKVYRYHCTLGGDSIIYMVIPSDDPRRLNAAKRQLGLDGANTDLTDFLWTHYPQLVRDYAPERN